MSIDNLQNLSEDTQEKMGQVFAWFDANVSRLEAAYKDIGLKFDKVSQELEEKNQQLVGSFMENESIKTQLKSVLTSMNSGVVMIDSEAVITMLNPAAESIYGLSAGSILGRKYESVFKPGNNESPLLNTLQQGQVYKDAQRLWEVNGVMRPIGFITSLVRDPSGKILGAVEISNDLTEFKKMQNQIQHQRTLAAIGQMAATVAHEIRNPLGAIGGFAGLLERDLSPEDSRRDLVNKIVQAVSSLNKIVSNLLVFSRPMELQLREIDMIEWMEEILRYAELEATRLEKKIEIKRNFEKIGQDVPFDPEKFQQVILNLTFNAIQSIDEEGRLTISIHKENELHLVLSIKDNGSGIPEEHRQQVFDPFFTTKEQGTGLGLAIVRRIVELHGGDISVESKMGRGTTFLIRLNLKAT